MEVLGLGAMSSWYRMWQRGSDVHLRMRRADASKLNCSMNGRLLDDRHCARLRVLFSVL